MSAATDVAFVDSALAKLETARRWTPRTISKLETLLNATDPWDLYRVDPLRFAQARGIDEQEAIDLFLHATNLGLFQMEWRLLCPMCSDTVSSCQSMTTVQSRCYCQLCQMATEVNLDDYIAVSFNLSPRVRELPWHKPETLSAADFLLRYRIASQAAYEGMGKMTDILRDFSKLLDHLKPGEARVLDSDIAPGWAAVGYDAAANRSFILAADGAPVTTPQPVRAEIAPDGWKLSLATLRPGPVRLTLVNPRAQPVPVALYVRPNEEGGPSLSLGLFLTGNRLVNNQTFRTLFRTETLASGEGLGVRDLTLLFTDLKGSTELYERVGDLSAFALVQQHFEHLRGAVQHEQGAVVKTIGDAVMAAFTQPEQAVRAALTMFREIEAFNNSRGKRELILKIGIHRGHSIAVTLNERLDYFGQTVNIAARVQGVANADEICLTEDVYKVPAVQHALQGMEAAPEQPRLKGIQESVPIRRVSIR